MSRACRGWHDVSRACKDCMLIYNFSVKTMNFTDELLMNPVHFVNIKVWFILSSGGFLNKYVVIKIFSFEIYQ